MRTSHRGPNLAVRVNRAIDDRPGIQQEAICYQWFKQRLILSVSGISRQRNSSYRPSRVNIVAQGLSTPDPSLSPTPLSIRRGRATTTHYTHHQVSLVVSRNTIH